MAAAVLTVVGSFIGCANMPTAPGPAPSSIATVPPAAPLPQPVQDAPTSARYTVVFDSTWSATSHPVDFPASAHYSGLIGATHAASVSFWTEGGLASEGIRRMAERGSKQPLDDEVNRAIGRGDAEYLLSGPDLRTSPGSTNLVFEISQAFPLVTLVTMVAPSPDWFVGVSGLPLFQDGRWIDEVRVDLFGFDAGTDSGITYTAPDHETTPRQPIARLTYPLTSSGPAKPLGTLTFTRTE
jgi:hypothetical protein